MESGEAIALNMNGGHMKAMTAEEVLVHTHNVVLPGYLVLPDAATGLVLFAHGSGSSRSSPRNRMVASMLNEAGIGTLLFDLLAPEEDIGMTGRFNIGLLADRLLAATASVAGLAHKHQLCLGYFGASTGAAAAIRTAARPPAKIRIAAMVSRGGRVDLSGHEALCELRVPTLMIVGEADQAVLKFSARAAAWMQCEQRLEVIPGATHPFEEPGAMERVGRLAAQWFCRYFAVAHSTSPEAAAPSRYETNHD
jgi:dienelactone hydrolase